jgi:hypothetical protein
MQAILVIVLCSLLAAAHAQEILFGAYNELRYAMAITFNSTVEASLPEQEQCPNGTGHILFSVDSFAANGPMITRDMGCCPSDYYGCWDDDVNQLLGCCPADAAVCCINPSGTLVGCATQVGQCCGSTICPVGYGCCSFILMQQYPEYYEDNRTGTICCPTDPASGDADAKDLYCDVITVNKDPSDPASFPRSYPAGCLHSFELTLTYCPSANVSCNASNVDSPQNETVCSICGNNTAECLVSAPIKCANDTDCRTFVYNTTEAQYNATNVTSMDIVGGCCPGNLTLCMNGDNSFQVGCADLSIGYSCCGDHICPPYMKCCTTLDAANNTNYLGCCPSATDCCIKNVVDPTAPADATDFFCGVAFNGTACEVNKFAEARWYVVTKPDLFNSV